MSYKRKTLKRTKLITFLQESSEDRQNETKLDDLEINTGLSGILQFLPDKDNNDSLKEKDNFNILDNASLIEIQIFSQSNLDINYILDVMSSVLINNKIIPFRHLKDCFGYDFIENIKNNIDQTTTKEKLQQFNKNLLIRNIQFLEPIKYNNIKELEQKQLMDLLKILLELNRQKYPNKSTLEHLKNTLNSIICMPELEIDFLIDILPNINVPYNELNKCIKTRYNDQFVKPQVSTEKLGELNKQLLIKNILEIQESIVMDKNKILDRETLNLLNNDELNVIQVELVARNKKVGAITTNCFNNSPTLQQSTSKKSTKNETQEIDKTSLISSIQQLSRYATDIERDLIKKGSDKCYFDDNTLKLLNIDTLQQINNNLLVYKLMEQEYYNYLIKENDEYLQLYKILQQINNNLLVYKLMEQEYYNYLIKENDEYLQLYKILLCDNEECKETNSAHIKLY